LAWLAPAGKTLDSPFSKLSSKLRYKSSTTTRNLRTLIKVGDVLKARDTAALEG
jgi:DNA-binding MarR family transcriptional regulator